MNLLNTKEGVKRVLVGKHIFFQKSYRIESNDGEILYESDKEITFSKLVNGQLYFQLKGINKLFTIFENQVLSTSGTWGLISSIELDNGLYIYHRNDTDTGFYIINNELQKTGKSIDKCRLGNKSFLFEFNKNIIRCYADRGNKLNWEMNFKTNISLDSNIENDRLYLMEKSNELSVVDIHSGQTKASLNLDGRFTVDDDKLYVINFQYLHVYNSENLTLLNSMDLASYGEKWANFFPTGQFTGNNDFLFCSDSNCLIAIIDTSTLGLSEILSFDKQIPRGENIIWYENMLYVRDIDNTLHIFQKE